MKNICFVSNYNKTYLFDAVAQSMLEADPTIKIYWIAVNSKIYAELTDKYGTDRVLRLSNKENSISTILCDDFNLNEIIYSDRVLKKKTSRGSFYLKSVANLVTNFIQANSIKCFVGELTWAHEVLIKRICDRNITIKCQYLNPHTIRIPYSRFALFTDDFQSVFLENGELISVDANIPNGSRGLEKPDYLKINDQLLLEKKKILSKVKRMCAFVFSLGYNDITDPTQEKKLNRLFVHMKFFLNRTSYHFLKKTNLEDLKNKKLIFYAFHKQPESSIDFFGRYYEDQYLNILNLWRKLPNNSFLVVKEHTNAVGDRGILFYKKIKKLNGVILINEKTDSHKIIDLCDAVFTVTGTIAYEAALKGKLSYTFSNTFFNKLSLCNRITLEDIREIDSLQDLFEEHYKGYDSINDTLVLKNIMKNSYEGIISDSISDSRCMNIENIEKISNVLLKVI